jgi:hypothetical protein
MAQHVTRRMILLSGVGAAMLLSRTAMSAWPMVTVHKVQTVAAVAAGSCTWKLTAFK